MTKPSAFKKNAGAHVEDGNIVKFPGYMVEEAIRTAPKNLVLAGREEKMI